MKCSKKDCKKDEFSKGLCHTHYFAEYRASHREELRKYQKKRHKNPKIKKRHNAQALAWYRRNKEKILTKKKEA
jgi:hypothetical protein